MEKIWVFNLNLLIEWFFPDSATSRWNIADGETKRSVPSVKECLSSWLKNERTAFASKSGNFFLANIYLIVGE